MKNVLFKQEKKYYKINHIKKNKADITKHVLKMQ